MIEESAKPTTLTIPVAEASTVDTPTQHTDITTTASNAAIAGSGELISAFLRYLTNVAMARMVTPSIFGIFGELYTLMLILGWFAKLGLDGVLLRLLPTYQVGHKPALSKGLIRFAVTLTTYTGLAVGVLLFLYADLIAAHFYHDAAYARHLQQISPLAPLVAIQLILAAGLQSFKSISWKIYVDRISQPLLTLAALLLFYFIGWRNEAPSFSVVVGFFGSVLLGQFALRRVLRRQTGSCAAAYDAQTWVVTALPMLFNGLIYGILNSADILFLGWFASAKDAAIYIAADRVSSFITMPLFALTMIFSPMIAEYHARGEQSQLSHMLKLVTRWSLSLSLPIFLGCVIFHHAILGIFGPVYTQGGVALSIICTGNMVNAASGMALLLLTMAGHLRLVSLNSVLTIAVNIALSLLLVPTYKVLGAALAISLATITLNVVSLVQAYSLMKIHPYRQDCYKPLLAGLVATCLAALLLFLLQPADTPFGIILELSVLVPFFGTYALVLFWLGIGKEDQLIFQMILRRLGMKKS